MLLRQLLSKVSQHTIHASWYITTQTGDSERSVELFEAAYKELVSIGAADEAVQGTALSSGKSHEVVNHNTNWNEVLNSAAVPITTLLHAMLSTFCLRLRLLIVNIDER